MDYSALANELLEKTKSLRRAKPQKNMDVSMQGEAFVLHYLANRDEGVLPGEISNEMRVSSARIAQALNNIEKKGWITRRIDTQDRRRILVDLTPEGKAAAQRHRQAATDFAVKMLSMLGEHDAREYVRITGRLAEMLRDFHKERL